MIEPARIADCDFVFLITGEIGGVCDVRTSLVDDDSVSPVLSSSSSCN